MGCRLSDHPDRGVIVEHGPPATIFTEASDPRTREFLSQIPGYIHTSDSTCYVPLNSSVPIAIFVTTKIRIICPNHICNTFTAGVGVPSRCLTWARGCLRNTLVPKLIKGNVMPDSMTIFRPVTTIFASLMLINTGHGQSNSAPVLSFKTPTHAEMFQVGSPVFVQVNASDPDGSVSHVRLSVDDVFVRQDNDAPYEWGNQPSDKILENLPRGVHSLTAVATDNNGAASTKTIIVEIVKGPVGGNDLPVVSFASPGNGETFAIDSQISVTVNATDPDGSVENVSLFLNGDLVRQDNKLPYEWEDSILQNLDAATHELLAVAVDDAGNSSAESITFTIIEK